MVREGYENKVDAWLWEREKEELIKKKNCIAWKVKSYHNDISEDKKDMSTLRTLVTIWTFSAQSNGNVYQGH